MHNSDKTTKDHLIICALLQMIRWGNNGLIRMIKYYIVERQRKWRMSVCRLSARGGSGAAIQQALND